MSRVMVSYDTMDINGTMAVTDVSDLSPEEARAYMETFLDSVPEDDTWVCVLTPLGEREGS
jgi:hypothetical protein